MTYADEVLADSPLAYYRLGESSGTSMVDSSGNGHDGSYVGSPTLGATGLLGGDSDTAMVADSGKYATTPTGSWKSQSTVTVEALINPSAISGTLPNRFIGNDDELGASRSYSLDLDTSGHLAATLWIAGSQRFCTGSTVLVTGNAYHVVMTYDGTDIKVYVNGVEDGNTSYSGTIQAGTAEIYIGCDPYPDYRTTWRFQGTIDEVAIYSGALSSTRIAAHADAAALNIIHPGAVAAMSSIAAVTPDHGADIAPGAVATTASIPTAEYAVSADIASDTVAATVSIYGMSNYAEHVLFDTPLAYYKLDERSGTTFTDSSGHNRTASLMGSGSTVGQAGALSNGGKALQVNGSGGLAIPHAADLDFLYFTMEFFLYWTSKPTNYTYVFCQTDNAPAFRFHNAAQTFIGTSNGLVGPTDFTSMSSGAWHHVAVTWNGANLITYFDGAQVQSLVGSGTLNASSSGWVVGGPGWDGSGIVGYIDEVALYDKALSPTRIAAHYKARLDPWSSVSIAPGPITATVDVPSVSVTSPVVPTSVAATGGIPWAVPTVIVVPPPVEADPPEAAYWFEDNTVQGFTTHGVNWDAPQTTQDFAEWWGWPPSYYVLKIVRNSNTVGDGYSLNDNVITLEPNTTYTFRWSATSLLSGADHFKIEVVDGASVVVSSQIYTTGTLGQWSQAYVEFYSGAHTSAQIRISDDGDAAPVAGSVLYLDFITISSITRTQLRAQSIVRDAVYNELQITADNTVVRGFWEIGAWTTIPSPEIPIGPATVAAVVAVPYADNGVPPGPITGLTATPLDLYSIQLEWTNPLDPDFDHVVIMRTDGLPYAQPGDELLDTDIVRIDTQANFDTATAFPVTSGTFSDAQDVTGRPATSPVVPLPALGNDSDASSWYVYTPATDGTLVTHTDATVPTNFDTILFLVAADGTTVLAYNDDDLDYVAHGTPQFSSWLEYVVTAGTTYYICVTGWGGTTATLHLSLSGPEPVVTVPNYIDSGLIPGKAYFYAVYTFDWAGNNDPATGVGVQATTNELPSGSPLSITLTMLAGSVSILPGTPIEPGPGDIISYYGVPIDVRLTEPAGVTWVNDLLQPPPAVPGETTGWPGNIFDPAIVRTPTDIRAEVWNYLNTEKISDLDYSAARQFLDEYNGVGSGSLQVPAIHPDAALLRRDRVLRFYYKDIADSVFASIIEGRKTNVVAEAGANWAAVSGRGILAWLEDAVVLPYVTDEDKAWLHDNPVAQSVQADGTRVLVESNIMPYAPDVRAFNFGSRDAFNHVMFNDVGPGSSGANQELLAPWSNLTSGDGVTYASRSDKVKGYPIGWPDPSAQWIWQTNPQADVQDGLQVSFRGFFTLGAETTVDIYGTADDTADFYIDGVQKLFSTTSWKTIGHIRVTLSQGQHELQITGRNAYLPALALNPASVIATIKNASGGAVIFRTNTTQWQYTRYINNFLVVEANHGPGWHRPSGITQSAKAPLNRKQYFPSDWPDPAAQWIWGSDPTHSSPGEQLCWFRAKVYIETSGTYRWVCTADDSYIMWVDGIEVLSLEYDGSAAGGWTRTDEVDLKLDRGFHVFAMRGRNATRPNPSDPRSNPAAVIGTLMTLDTNLKPYAPVAAARTYYTGPSADQGWFANWAASAWKAGDVLYTLVNEAKARGVTRLQNVTMDFDAATDSNGQEWTTRVSRTWDVGTSLLQVAFDLCELGVDIWMTPDRVLHCAERRGSDVPTFSVLYGKNISGYDTDETFTGASVAYTRTRTGWFTLESDTSSLIVGGRRETAISLANTDSEDIMVGVSHRAIGAVVMANMVATAQSIVPVEGSVPYVDANISDIIYVLSPDGSSRMGRLLSITLTENEAGATTWVPEIEIWNSPFGDGVDPSKPHDPVDPNSPYDPSTWVPAAEDWTRFIPDGAGSDYPRAVTLAQASAWVDGTPSPSPSGATPVPLNSAQAPRPVVNAQNNGTPPNAERVAVSPTAPLITAGYHLWVDTSGIV